MPAEESKENTIPLATEELSMAAKVLNDIAFFDDAAEALTL